jgi:sugar fermentation stimulation protein A
LATYVLLIEFPTSQVVTIGARGMIPLASGYYLYVGSARKSWQKRLARHCGKKKKKHWHIDYILDADRAMVQEVWLSRENWECLTCQSLIALQEIVVPVAKIGSSDCRCPAHFLLATNGFAIARQTLEDKGFNIYIAD